MNSKNHPAAARRALAAAVRPPSMPNLSTPPSFVPSFSQEFQRVGYQIEQKRFSGAFRIGIVRALFRAALTERMQSVVEKRTKTLGARITQSALVRGALETPFLTQTLLKRTDVDGVVVLAVVIKGQTTHDDVVVREATSALIDLSLRYNKPVGIGIIGPGVSQEQAQDRVEEYAQGALDAVVLSLSQPSKKPNLENKTVPAQNKIQRQKSKFKNPKSRNSKPKLKQKPKV